MMIKNILISLLVVFAFQNSFSATAVAAKKVVSEDIAKAEMAPVESEAAAPAELAIEAPTEVVTNDAAVATADAQLAEAEQPLVAEAVAAPVVAVEKMAESEIPLNIEASKKPVEASSATKALMSIVVVLGLAAASYFGIRKYKFSNKILKSNAQIKVISQHYLGPKKSLAIVHVAGESMLLGITDQNISMIKSLSLIDDEVPAQMPKTFSESMTANAKMTQPMIDELDEEFSFAGVTDTVSKKIKSMRSFS